MLLHLTEDVDTDINGSVTTTSSARSESPRNNVTRTNVTKKHFMPVWVFCVRASTHGPGECEEVPIVHEANRYSRCFRELSTCRQCRKLLQTTPENRAASVSDCAGAIKSRTTSAPPTSTAASTTTTAPPTSSPKMNVIPESKGVHNGGNDEGQGNGSVTGAEQAFKDADLDGSGFLEEEEMQKFLSKMNMQGFDWKTLDADHDDKVSLNEFNAAMGEGNKHDSDASHHFKDADLDHSGFLEEEEIQKLLSQMNAEGFDWKTLDVDHDGKLSENEFAAAMGG